MTFELLILLLLFPNSEITGMGHQNQFMQCWGSDLRLCAYETSTELGAQARVPWTCFQTHTYYSGSKPSPCRLPVSLKFSMSPLHVSLPFYIFNSTVEGLCVHVCTRTHMHTYYFQHVKEEIISKEMCAMPNI